VVCSFDQDTRDGISFERTQEYPAQCITNGYTVTWFQGAEFELGFEFIRFLEYDLVRFLEI
jgi:hypothetical protein